MVKAEALNFATIIERLRRKKRLSYMDAIIYYCEENDFDVEQAAKIITPEIKSRLKVEAEDLNFLPKSKERLPI